jgi:hypothetical protein
MRKGHKKKTLYGYFYCYRFLMVLDNSYVDRFYHFYLGSISKVDPKVSCSQKYFEVIFMYVNQGYKWG